MVITLPDTSTTTGRVVSVGRVAIAGAQGGSTTVAVAVELDHPSAAGRLDQAPVQVSITTASVDGALVVPVNALLALAGGGYGLELVDALRRPPARSPSSSGCSTTRTGSCRCAARP